MSTIENPGVSLFHGTDINVNNSQNNEEDEDLEDQIRRREELQNLLQENLDEFKYDDSTINSSTNVSILSLDDAQKDYRDATHNDQLKVLFDVKVREINTLQKEFEKYKQDKCKEIENLKNKCILFEADLRQVQLAHKNAENLLVDKANLLKELTKKCNTKDTEIASYKKDIDNYNLEISSYKSKINELQMKIADNHPFNMGVKVFESEELRKAHENEIRRLEAVSEEYRKNSEAQEKVNVTLKTDLNRLLEYKNEMESEFKKQIAAFSANLTSAHQQCKDLIDVAETMKHENDHFRARIESYEKNEPILTEDDIRQKKLDYESLLRHFEKLKRMLVDKSVELNTLKSKTKFYETDIRELLEYRDVKLEMQNYKFKSCGDDDHLRGLLILQTELKNISQIIEDKDKQIANLNSANKDLQEKIEERLLQTKSDIQNFSHKYNMPQLEVMSQELKKSEEKCTSLEQQLMKLKASPKKELQALKENIKSLEKEKEENEELLNSFKENINKYEETIRKLQEFNQDIMMENKKLKQELKVFQGESDRFKDSSAIKSEYDQLKEQLNQVLTHLQRTNETQEPKILVVVKKEIDDLSGTLRQTDVDKNIIEEKLIYWRKQLDCLNIKNEDEKIANLQETVEELNSAKTIAEGEKYSLQFKLKDCESHIETLKEENACLRLTVDQYKDSDLQIHELKQCLENKEQEIKLYEKEKHDLLKAFESTKNQLGQIQNEALIMEKELMELREKNIRRNLEKELREAENQLEQSRIEENEIVTETEYFKKALQTEILKVELKLRENFQRDYSKKLAEIEGKYAQTILLYKKEIEAKKDLEQHYRECTAKIISESSKKIIEMEHQKGLFEYYIKEREEQYKKDMKKMEREDEKLRKIIEEQSRMLKQYEMEWRKWTKNFIQKWTNIEEHSRTVRMKVLSRINTYDKMVNEIENNFNKMTHIHTNDFK